MAKVASKTKAPSTPTSALRLPPDQDARNIAINNFDEHICVEAGAGSGKTRVLVDRFIALLDARVPLNEIVAITFTEKAAAEMRERVRNACKKRAQEAQDDSVATTRWREIERQITGARITTIHAFCGAFLREHALVRGIDPDFAILTEAEARLLQRDVAESALQALLDAGDAQAQLLAVECGVDRTVAGLVRLLQQRHDVRRTAETFDYTVPEKLRADWARAVREEFDRQIRLFAQSDALTKSIQELETFGDDCTDPKDGREKFRCLLLEALRAMQAGRLRESEMKLEQIAAYKISNTRADRWGSKDVHNSIKKVQEKLKKRLSGFLPPKTEDADEREAAELTAACYRVFRETAAAYTEAKRAQAAYDFDDLLVETWEALRTDERIRAATAASIRHLLIDEFQDTDPVQYGIARLLMRRDNLGGPTLFIVGDPKQAIYDFRGADIAVYAQARAESETQLNLTTNFRSLPGVLAFPNHFFERSGALQGEHVRFVPLDAYREGGDEAHVEFLVPPFEEPPGADEGRRAEAAVIAWRLRELVEGDQPAMVHDGDATRPAEYGDIALLFRANSDMHIYEEALRKADIPFNVVAGKGFFERQEVHDFRNLLNAVADPWNEFSLLGFLRSPVAAMTDDAIFELTDNAKGLAKGFYGAWALKDEKQNARLDAARGLVAQLQARMHEPLPVFLEYALGESALESIVLSQHHGVQKAGNLRKLLDLAEEFSRTTPPTLARFLRYLEEVAAEELREGDAPLVEGGTGAVTLMNVHQAKGLEFSIVVVADCGRGVRDGGNFEAFRVHRRLGLSVRLAGEDGETVSTAIAAAIKAAEREQGESEHQRIFYVALTRARDRLLIGGCKLRSCSGSWFEKLAETFDLDTRAHGGTIAGDGWSALVWRTADDPGPRRANASAPDAVDWPRHIRRMASIDPQAQAPQIISVTALLARMAGDEEELSHYGAAARAGALRRGQLVHRLFELWNLGGPAPDVETFLAAEAPAYANDVKLREGLNRIVAAFPKTGLFAAFCAHGPVQREVPFLLPLEGVMITGTVDALLADHTLVDFKTGTRDAKKLEQYTWQLQLYAWAIDTLTGRAPTRAVLYFVDEEYEHEVDVSAIAVADTYARAEAVLRGK